MEQTEIKKSHLKLIKKHYNTISAEGIVGLNKELTLNLIKLKQYTGEHCVDEVCDLKVEPLSYDYFYVPLPEGGDKTKKELYIESIEDKITALRYAISKLEHSLEKPRKVGDLWICIVNRSTDKTMPSSYMWRVSDTKDSINCANYNIEKWTLEESVNHFKRTKELYGIK